MMLDVKSFQLQSFLPLPYEEVLAPRLKRAHEKLQSGSGAGGEFTGWVHLPRDYDREEFARIQAAASRIRANSQALVVIGIGGSYLGARGVIDCLRSPNYNLKRKDTPNIYFVGNGLSSDAMGEVLDLVADVDFSVNVISKSGTTTEPAVAFRFFRAALEKKYGREGARERIYATTDKARGALKSLADSEGWETFVVPDDVGGRYSVLTAVGLLPIAVAGVDITALMQGAAEMMETCTEASFRCPAWRYAAIRYELYRAGRSIELLACYDPAFRFMAEWWKQLFGESEGRFSADAVSEAQRKFMGTLWNTYAFYVLYAEIDGFDPTKHTLKRENLTPMDKWVLSRLNTLIKTVDSNLDGLHITEAGRELARFTDDLSNWYVRRCRERYWGSGMTDDKEAAYMTLYTVLATMSALCAPFTPFMSESIYQNIVRSVDKTAPESIHLCDFPVADESLIDAELERSMDEVLEIVVLGRAARAAANVKNRQPLARMFVQGGTLDALYTSIIADELNVKAVEFVNDASSFISYRVKPQLKTLGPRYGKLLPKINAYLAQDGIGDKVVAAHKAGNSYDFELEGTAVSLAEADVLTEPIQKAGFVSQTEKETAVVLDTNLTDELVDEGFVRELVSKIQVMRKEAGFEVTDRIALTYACVGRAKDVLSRFGDAIAQDVLAVSVSDAAPAGYVKEWDVNGEKVTLGVEKK